MSQPVYRIFSVPSSPIAENGKKIAKFWKKADILTDLYCTSEMKKSETRSRFSMLFDKEALYITMDCTSPISFRGETGEQNSITIFLAAGEDEKRYLQLFVKENGFFATVINEKELDLPEIRSFISIKENARNYKVECRFIVPFTLLQMDPVQKGASLRFSVSHCRPDPEWECIDYLSANHYVDGSFVGVEKDGGYLGIKNWGKAEFSLEEALPQKHSVSKRFLQEGKKGVLKFDLTNPLAPYKNILGMNNSPRIKNAAGAILEKELFKRLGPARVRHHDAALNDGGYALIDVSRIFPLFRADHNDPENYDFGPTDLCLSYVKECGVPIEFRFGESIEHSQERFRVKPPKDREKWAEICVNILRHYLEGWHNGMQLDITHASLWEEPDNIRLFDGSFEEEFFPLYKAFSTALKKRFPNVKVGGVQSIGLRENFLAYCRENKLVLDFYSTTGYSRQIHVFRNKALLMKETAKKYGYGDAGIFISEWHYGPRSWKNFPPFMWERESVDNAAFSVVTLIELQDVVDMAYFYEWTSIGLWGLFLYPQTPFPVYYALCFYTDFIRKNGKSLPLSFEKGLLRVSSLASIEDDGTINVLLARFKSPVEELAFPLPEEYKKCRMKMVTEDSLTGEEVKEFCRQENEHFSIPFPGKKFGVYMLEFSKE